MVLSWMVRVTMMMMRITVTMVTGLTTGMMRATRSTMGMINTIKTTSFGILKGNKLDFTRIIIGWIDNKYPRHIIETPSQHILVSSLLQTRGISNTTLFTPEWLSTPHSSYNSTRGSSHTIKESISFDKRFSSTLLSHIRHNSHSFTQSHIRLNSHSFTHSHIRHYSHSSLLQQRYSQLTYKLSFQKKYELLNDTNWLTG